MYMKHTSIITLIICTIFIYACGDPAAKGKSGNPPVIVSSLSLNDIFDPIKVGVFLKNNMPSSKESNDLFLKGMDAFKNKNLLDSAKYYLEHSIQKYPTPNAYFELGNVYKALKSLEKSLESYQFAERLDYAPFSNVLYQKAGVFALKGDNELASQHIQYALQAGFTDINKFNTDKAFDSLRINEEFRFIDAIKKGTRGMSNPEALFWLQFKKQFATPSYPSTLKGDLDLTSFKIISYDFERFVPEMRNAEFSRDVGESYYYAYNIGENEYCTAILYTEVIHYVGDFMPKKFILATFDSRGKLIDKKRIEGFGMIDEELIDLQLQKPFNFIAKVYEMEFEKPLDDAGLWENKIKNKKLLAAYQYKIDAKGTITYHQENKASDLATK